MYTVGCLVCASHSSAMWQLHGLPGGFFFLLQTLSEIRGEGVEKRGLRVEGWRTTTVVTGPGMLLVFISHMKTQAVKDGNSDLEDYPCHTLHCYYQHGEV